MTLIRIAAATLVLAGLSQSALAAPITCIDTPGPRTWTLGEATACGTGPGNPNASADINGVEVDVGAAADFAGTWAKEGDVTQEGDLSSLLNVSLNAGSAWGSQPIAGTWTLVANFWSMYSGAVITIHVGGGPQNPDDFAAFRITSGQLTGTWSFSQGAGANGGGLSNVGIWTTGPRQVPEPMTLGLLGLGLAGVGLMRRRRRA